MKVSYIVMAFLLFFGTLYAKGGQQDIHFGGIPYHIVADPDTLLLEKGEIQVLRETPLSSFKEHGDLFSDYSSERINMFDYFR